MASAVRVVGSFLLCAGLASFLVACASVHDPESTRDSLNEVTEDPQEPTAAERFDANLNPEPVVAPLPCSEYLILTVRGTGEPLEGQLLSPVARHIAQSQAGVSPEGESKGDAPEVLRQELIDDDARGPTEGDSPVVDYRPGAQVIDLNYPADTNVKEGSTVGVRMLIDTLNVQASQCTAQGFVLLGYSQGALVVGDSLSDPEERMVGATVGVLSDPAAAQIRAVVLYGDPRFVGNAAYNAGTFNPSMSGLMPRDEGSLDSYAERLRDFCAAADFICQSSLGLSEQGHVAYFSNGMQEEGAAFAISRLNAEVNPPDENLPGEADE